MCIYEFSPVNRLQFVRIYLTGTQWKEYMATLFSFTVQNSLVWTAAVYNCLIIQEFSEFLNEIVLNVTAF